MENIKLSDQELEKIDSEVMNAISGGNAFMDKSKELATKAGNAFMALPKRTRRQIYALGGIAAFAAVAEGADQIIFKGKGTEKVVNLTGEALKSIGKGFEYASYGINWAGEQMANVKCARGKNPSLTESGDDLANTQ